MIKLILTFGCRLVFQLALELAHSLGKIKKKSKKARKYARGSQDASPRESSLDMGVPIAAANQLLAENHITVDPGLTTQLWHIGLDQFEAGQFKDAEATFQKVAKRQFVARFTGKPYAPTSRESISIESHYVQEMIDRCRQ